MRYLANQLSGYQAYWHNWQEKNISDWHANFGTNPANKKVPESPAVSAANNPKLCELFANKKMFDFARELMLTRYLAIQLTG